MKSITQLMLMLTLVLFVTGSALAVDVDVNTNETFYYPAEAFEMTGTLYGTRNGNRNPEHNIQGWVATTNLYCELEASDFAANSGIHTDVDSDSPATDRTYTAYCDETIQVSRIGFYNVHFTVLSGI